MVEPSVASPAGTAKPPPSVLAASMNLTKNLIGAGMFSLPAALLRGSVLPGMFAMASVGVLSGSSFILIAYLCQELKCRTYREIWCVAFGRRTAFLVDTCIIVNGFFACVAYTILIADFFEKALDGLFGWAGVHRAILIWVNTGVFLLPLSMAKDLSALRFTSMMGLAIIGLVFLYIVSDCLGQIHVARANLEAHSMRLNVGIFSTIALCTGAFQAHYNGPRIFEQLDCNLGAHAQTVMASFGTAFVVYGSFALSGLGLFGEKVLGNVLRNYSADGNVAILLAWLGMAFAVIFTYPLVFTAARDSLVDSHPFFVKLMKTRGQSAHTGITFALVIGISLVAGLVEDVSLVTGMLGAFIGSSLCWIVPGSIYLKMALGGASASTNDLEQALLERKKAAGQIKGNPALSGFAAALIVLGFISMGVSMSVVLGIL